MASVPATLRIVSAEMVGPSTRTLDIERVDGAPFSSIAGKYVIVNTGVSLPDGKAAKRAYSLMPVVGTSARCRMTIKRLGDGPGSNALHAADVGAEFSFSGPWGKLVPEGGLTEPTLFVATDTGITSALSAAEELAEPHGPLEVLWLRTDDETFLDVDGVRRRIEARGASFRSALIPAVRSSRRVIAAQELVDARVAERCPRVVLGSGDGDIVHPLRARFASSLAGACDVRIECFFNNPERKSG
jgi:hypothetical protein